MSGAFFQDRECAVRLFGYCDLSRSFQATMYERITPMFDFGVYRSRTNKMLLGVCGGLAEYFDVSSKMVRLITIGLAIFLPGISIWGVALAYIVLGLVLPVKDSHQTFH